MAGVIWACPPAAWRHAWLNTLKAVGIAAGLSQIRYRQGRINPSLDRVLPTIDASSVMYSLELVNHENANLWEATLKSCPDSLPFHSIAWREALSNTFKQLMPVYFLIKANDNIIGGLPTFVFQPIRGIKMLHSMPWDLFGGIQLNRESSVDFSRLFEDVDMQLDPLVDEENLCETVFTLSPGQTELYGQKLIAAGYQQHEVRFTHFLKICSDYDLIWGAYNRRVRGAIRKAAKTGVTVYNTNSISDLESFYEIYLATQKRLRETPKPLPMLKSLLRSNISQLVIAKYSGLIIAGLLYLHFNRTVMLWVGASVPEFWEYRPNNTLVHHIVKWACEAGYRWVDFGMSPPDNYGVIAFKEAFRAQRSNFANYIKIHSPIKRAMWEKSEPALQQLNMWVQQSRS